MRIRQIHAWYCNKLQKYLKLVLHKMGTLQLPSPNGLGFQVKKLVVTNLKFGKKFSLYPCLGLFHQNHPNNSLKPPIFVSELWLDRFWGNRHSKIKKNSANSLFLLLFFFAFLSCYYGFTNCFEKLNFVSSNTFYLSSCLLNPNLLGLVLPEI